eukprot:gene10878-10959_t
MSAYVDKRLSTENEATMPSDTTTRWTVSVSKDTDISVRSFLAQRGMKKGDLSKFIEDAVKWRVLEQTMSEARGKFSDLEPQELDDLISEAPPKPVDVRLVIDTNILISALLASQSLPASLIGLLREGRFNLLTSSEQLDELRCVTRYPKIRERLAPAIAGRLMNEIRDLAIVRTDLPIVTASPDPNDNFLLAIASSGSADFLVTGDKRDLLALKLFEGTKIITVRDFLDRSSPNERADLATACGVTTFTIEAIEYPTDP